MIAKFVAIFDANRARLLDIFSSTHPGSYDDIVKTVIQMLNDVLSTDDNTYSGEIPDPDRIKTIDYGDYQGTRLFVIAAGGYQPSQFWYVKIGYGSCSYCDTFQSIQDLDSRYDDDGNKVQPTDRQAREYLTLALHVIQGLKAMQEDI